MEVGVGKRRAQEAVGTVVEHASRTDVLVRKVRGVRWG